MKCTAIITPEYNAFTLGKPEPTNCDLLGEIIVMELATRTTMVLCTNCHTIFKKYNAGHEDLYEARNIGLTHIT